MGLQGIRTATMLVAASATIGLAACGDDDNGPTERTLGFTEGEGSVTNTVDLPPRTFSRQEGTPGDGWVFTKPLRDEAGKRAGNIYATCAVFTRGRNPKATCDGVIQLDDGTLAFNEVFRPEDKSRRAAITGGTGSFAGATGAYRGGGQLGNKDEIRLFLP